MDKRDELMSSKGRLTHVPLYLIGFLARKVVEGIFLAWGNIPDLVKLKACSMLFDSQLGAQTCRPCIA
jgi:hypothetical protein